MPGIISRQFAPKRHTLGVLLVLLVAMVLRGMVPNGYMADFEAGRKGEPLFAFCSPEAHGDTPGALLALWADVDIAPGSEPDTSTMAASCAFCVPGQLTMGLPETGDLPAIPAFFASHPVIARGSSPLPPAGSRGPPLGSRAPPLFLI